MAANPCRGDRIHDRLGGRLGRLGSAKVLVGHRTSELRPSGSGLAGMPALSRSRLCQDSHFLPANGVTDPAVGRRWEDGQGVLHGNGKSVYL